MKNFERTITVAMSKETATGLPAIRACLFDMDGLLINSETLYTEVSNQLLREYGKPDLTWDVKARLQGRTGPDSYRLFQHWAQLPISQDEAYEKIKYWQQQLFPLARPMPGVINLLRRLKASRVNIALASSTNVPNFKLKTSHLPELVSSFDADKIVLGDDPRVPEGRGKPAPDIYLLALQTINDALKAKGEPEVYPEECLVFEDSVAGVEAGRRAGMQVAWCPEMGLLEVYREKESLVLAGLTGEYNGITHSSNRLVEQGDLSVKDNRPWARIRGRPGEIDDGWGRLYSSLVAFPLKDYGIVEV